jgi:hypothetical protein
MSCAQCPCPVICLGWPVFCEWAAKTPPAATEILHICGRSRREDLPPDPAPIPLTESLPLLRLVNLCLYRSRDAACGCSGHRCALRSDLVTHLDCLDCVRTYGQA